MLSHKQHYLKWWAGLETSKKTKSAKPSTENNYLQMHPAKENEWLE